MNSVAQGTTATAVADQDAAAVIIQAPPIQLVSLILILVSLTLILVSLTLILVAATPHTRLTRPTPLIPHTHTDPDQQQLHMDPSLHAHPRYHPGRHQPQPREARAENPQLAARAELKLAARAFRPKEA
jgi:hypothetical protein